MYTILLFFCGLFQSWFSLYFCFFQYFNFDVPRCEYVCIYPVWLCKGSWLYKTHLSVFYAVQISVVLGHHFVKYLFTSVLISMLTYVRVLLLLHSPWSSAYFIQSFFPVNSPITFDDLNQIYDFFSITFITLLISSRQFLFRILYFSFLGFPFLKAHFLYLYLYICYEYFFFFTRFFDS